MSEEEIPTHEFVRMLYGKTAPVPRELVIGIVVDIQDHGIYLHLPEYNKTAYVPLRELGRGIVRSPRQHYTINQMVVARVYKTAKGGLYINASLRRLSQKEAQSKLLYWRKLNRSAHLAKLIANELNMELHDVIQNIFKPLVDYYETPFDALEDSLIKGKHILEECGVPEEYIDILYKIAKENILIRKQRMKFTVEIGTLAPDGINRIKEALMAVLNEFKDIEVRYESAPRYSVWVEGFERSTIRRRFAEFVDKLENYLLSLPDANKYKTFIQVAERKK